MKDYKNSEFTGYKLTRTWFDFKFENPGKIKASHTELYFYIIDLWNRLGQKEKFGLPTAVTMECLGIGSYNTYKRNLNDLIDFGFILLIQESKNQHQSKVIALSKFDKATDKALDKAHIKATDEAIDKATDDIDKQYNNEQKNNNIINNNNEIIQNFNFSEILKYESPEWIESVSMQQKITAEEIQNKIDEFELFLKTIEKKHQSKKEFVNHFINWLGKNPVKTNPENSSKKKNYDFDATRIIETNTKKPYRFDLETAITEQNNNNKFAKKQFRFNSGEAMDLIQKND